MSWIRCRCRGGDRRRIKLARESSSEETGMGDESFETWLKRNPPPDLQALVESGRRYALAIGEEYVEDPSKRPPHQGGYQHITPEEWAEHDRAMKEWRQLCRTRSAK
jgi:hypothetical protein